MITPHRIEFWGFLAILLGAFFLLARFWPDDKSDATLRQDAAEILGLFAGLLALAFWLLRLSLAEFGRWLWSRHPGRHLRARRVRQGKGRRPAGHHAAGAAA
jgi:hypothetical protein